MKFDPLDVY